MADHQQGRACGRALRKEQIEKVRLRASIKGRCRFVGHNQGRRANQGPRDSNPLLLTHAQTVGGGGFYDITRQAKRVCQGKRGGARIARTGPSRRCKAQRQHDVINRRGIGQEVELLEHDADLFRPKTIPPGGA